MTPKRLPLAVALEREARAAGVEAAVDLEAEPPYSTRRLQPLPSVSDVIAKDALSEGGARRGALTRGARSRGCRDDAVATLAAVVADADALPLSGVTAAGVDAEADAAAETAGPRPVSGCRVALRTARGRDECQGCLVTHWHARGRDERQGCLVTDSKARGRDQSQGCPVTNRGR